MVRIPEGWFWMGSDNRYRWESPRHRIWLNEFAIAEIPVTRAGYAQFLSDTGHARPAGWDDPNFSSEDQPVVDQVVTAEPVENRRLMSTRMRRRPRMERPVLRASRDLRSADGWVPPEIGGLQNRYGSSLLDEFVLGHSTSDVLTELVQNEFDAS